MKTTSTLTQKQCKPCSEGTSPLKGKEIESLSRGLGSDWQVVEEHHLEKKFAFEDFKSALKFTNRVGEIAETLGHHPDIFLTYGQVILKIWTHSVNGLSENDFILAAKADTTR